MSSSNPVVSSNPIVGSSPIVNSNLKGIIQSPVVGQNSVVDTNSPTIVKPAQPVITNVIPPNDKETTITADHHVTKYVARVPEDATEDQMAKVVSKLREKLAPKQALRP